jgi:hypothetical protein
MAIPNSTDPGIYYVVTRLDNGYFRKWDGERWYTNGTTLEAAIHKDWRSFEQSFYLSKIKEAVSVTLVANFDGTPLEAPRESFQQLDLFQ